jgi:hypothetical protein
MAGESFSGDVFLAQIASSIPGRLRLRDPALREESTLPQVLVRLQALPGVLRVARNPQAASVTLHYDSQMTSPVIFAAAALKVFTPSAVAEPAVASRREWRRRANRYAKYGAIASLVTSLAFAAAGRKRAHTLTGGVFLAFLGLHMAIHRRNLLR